MANKLSFFVDIDYCVYNGRSVSNDLLIYSDVFSLDGKESLLEFEFDASMSVLTLRKPGVNAGLDWTVVLQ